MKQNLKAVSPAVPPPLQAISVLATASHPVRAVDGERFVRAMRGAATGVNIVTTDGPSGRFGLTVSAFSSVSAEPPTVLVCINRRSPLREAIRDNRSFCVNVLAAAQQPLADRFAGRPADGKPYDFAAAKWRRACSGSPLLEASVASFDCSLASAVDAGSHTIFIGTVNAVGHRDTDPLLYANRSYSRPCDLS